MKNIFLIAILGVFLLLGGAGCSATQQNKDKDTKNIYQTDKNVRTKQKVLEKTSNITQNSDLVIKEFNITARKWQFEPAKIIVNKGDLVKLHIKSIDVRHGFALPVFGINKDLSPGNTVNIEFVASKQGTFSFACSVYCGAGHGDMLGVLIVN